VYHDRKIFHVLQTFAYGNGTQPMPFGHGTRPDIPVVRIKFAPWSTLSFGDLMTQLLRSTIVDILTCFVSSHIQQAIVPGQPSMLWAFAVNAPTAQLTSPSHVLLAESIGYQT
jgi:hypothetical protein